jgi:tellurite resistance protein TehA-like permease
MTPVWVFPAYPLLLTAPFGGNLVAAAASTGQLSSSLNGVPVALAAVTVQGTGFLISFMVCAAFLYRLMTQKLPRDHQRPGVFISIGPGGFTAAGLGMLSVFLAFLSSLDDVAMMVVSRWWCKRGLGVELWNSGMNNARGLTWDAIRCCPCWCSATRKPDDGDIPR